MPLPVGTQATAKSDAVACVPTGNSIKSLPLPVSPQATNHIQQLIFINHFKNK